MPWPPQAAPCPPWLPVWGDCPANADRSYLVKEALRGGVEATAPRALAVRVAAGPSAALCGAPASRNARTRLATVAGGRLWCDPPATRRPCSLPPPDFPEQPLEPPRRPKAEQPPEQPPNPRSQPRRKLLFRR